MNDSTDTTTPASGKEPISLTFDPAAIARMDPQNLRAFASAVSTISEVVTGICNQPRFWVTDTRRSEAGEMLETIAEGLGGLFDGIFKQAKAATASTAKEAEDLAWCKLHIRAIWGDEMDELAVLAAECVRDVNAAEWRDRHPQRAA